MKSELRTSLVLNQVMSFFLNDLRLAWNDTVFPKPRWFAVAGSACDAATRIVNPSQGCRDGDPGKFSDGAVCRESADLSHPSLPSLGDLNPDLRWSDPNTIFRHATDMQGPLSFGPLMCGNNVGTQALTNPSPVGTMFNKLVDFIYDLNK